MKTSLDSSDPASTSQLLRSAEAPESLKHEVEGIVEVPHGHERLSLIQAPDPERRGVGPNQHQARRGPFECNQSGQEQPPTARIRVRSRVRSEGAAVAKTALLLGEYEDRGRSVATRVQGCDRNASSPAPVVGWGVRFASRYSLRSLQAVPRPENTSQGERLRGAAEDASSDHKPTCEGSAKTFFEPRGPTLRCDNLVEGLRNKGLEYCAQPKYKVTVCEEFPARCPRNVMRACLVAELQCLLNHIQSGVNDLEDGCVGDLDPLPYEVPEVLRSLQLCSSSNGKQGVSYGLERVGWSMNEGLDEAVESLANAHYVRCRMLEASHEDVEGWMRECEEGIFGEVQALERELRILQGIEHGMLRRLEKIGRGCTEQLCVRSAEVLLEGDEHGSAPREGDDLPPLQTKIVSQQQVRQELCMWRGPMEEEVESLVQKTEAVEDLSETQYEELVKDPAVHVELIPGKMVYVWKSSGRRRARMVGCGNFCEQDSGAPRADLFASGAGAESIRMMVRRCSMEPLWHVVSVDVKTAFLQAPLLEMQKDGKAKITVVRVPTILKEAGVTKAKYWRVKKALYGLNSAPRSWSTHRDKVLTDLRIKHGDDTLRLQRLAEDANLWHILKCSGEDEESDDSRLRNALRIGVIALYVDDILVASEKSVARAVVEGLKSRWELSSPDWLSAEGDCLKFAGFELVKTSKGIRLHQESYTKDLLEQYQDTILGTERVPAIKVGERDAPTDRAELLELTKRAQSLVGQLLWLAGRTRPDISYAVNLAAQKIVPSPREAVDRAEHIIKYLRHAPDVGLHYKQPSGRCGRWEQLKFQEVGPSLDAFSDASFAADEKSRSYGCIQLFWGGALIFWASSRQTLIASHTAESELYSLSEAHLLGKAMRPTVAALMDVSEKDIDCRLHCDNAAAIQLCVLESGSWRTRHLRLRGAVIRQDIEKGLWQLTHLDGVFMPADIGTKPVGPSRLEDLMRVCDLWAPHLAESKEPPRPQVASMSCEQSSVAKALLALLLLVQVSGAKAMSTSPQGELQEFLPSFVVGFGIGCGWWLAGRVGSWIERHCCRRLVSGSVGPRRPAKPLVSSVEVQTVGTEPVRSLAAGEREFNVGPIQSEGNVPPLSEAEQEALLEMYEQLYAEQVAENLQVDGPGGSSRVEWRPLPGALDRDGSPEVLSPAVDSRAGGSLEAPFRSPPEDMLAQARAPTVPMPPGYRYPIVMLQPDPVPQEQPQVNRFVYVDDEVELPSSASEDVSSLGEWTTDSGMPRGPSGDSRESSQSGVGGSVRSRCSGRSIAAVSLAASVGSAEGQVVNGRDDGQWELWIAIGVLACLFALIGAGVTCIVLRCPCTRSPYKATSPCVDVAEAETEKASLTPECRLKLEGLQVSPVVNITIRNDGQRVPCMRGSDESSEIGGGQSAHSLGMQKDNDSRDPVVSPSGLGPEVSLGGRRQPEPSSLHSGLGPEVTLGRRQPEPSSLPSGLGPEVTLGRRQPEPSSLPSGLGPEVTLGRRQPETTGRSDSASGSGVRRRKPDPEEDGVNRSSQFEAAADVRRGSGGACSGGSVVQGLAGGSRPVDAPLDRFPRPWGLKHSTLLSSRGGDVQPFVYLTQNGECLHSGTTCRAMQFASAPIQRSICGFCMKAGQLPSRRGLDGKDRVVCFTKSGHYIHSTTQCRCLDASEEVQFRKLCRCCRWE